MENTFSGLVYKFPNVGIHAIFHEVMNFRKQVVVRPERLSASGWNDALNLYLMTGLEEIAETVKRVTYSPQSSDPAAARELRLAEAGDTTKKLADAFDGRSINSDDIVMQAALIDIELPYDLSGAHPDIPQPTPENMPNAWLMAFVQRLDRMATAATRLDSRFQPCTINKQESAQLLAMLGELYAVCVLKGGEANRQDTPTGVLPLADQGTYKPSGGA